MSTINSLSQSLLVRKEIGTLQREMSELQRKIGSDQTAVTYGGYGATDAKTVVDLRNDVKRMTAYKSTITVVDARAARLDIAYGKLSELGTSVRGETLKVSTQGVEPKTLQAEAQLALSTAVDQLNSQVSGHFLFSGQQADQAPFDLATIRTGVQTALASVMPGDDAAAAMAAVKSWFATTTNWYAGGAPSSPVNIADDRTITPEGQGDASEIGEFLTNLAVVAYATFDPDPLAGAGFQTMANYTQLMETAGVQLTTAVDQLEGTRARNGAARASMASQVETYEDLLTATGQNLNDIEQVDLAEAIARLNQMQTTLQATYKTESELRQLSLANFL